MRKKLCFVMLLSAILMAGCSKGGKGVIEVAGGKIIVDGVETTLTEHTNDTAKEPFALNPQLSITYSTHAAFGDCPNNPQGVAVGNVTKSERDKSISYFSSYGGSQYTMHKETKDGMICGFLYSPESVQLEVAINQLTNSINATNLGNITKVKIGLIEVHDWSSIVVTPTSVSVLNAFSILQGNVNTTETVEINKQSVGYLSDAAYDYYQYGDYVVQALKGYDISPCITFLKE